jgi:hypothetical protein
MREVFLRHEEREKKDGVSFWISQTDWTERRRVFIKKEAAFSFGGLLFFCYFP